MSLDAVLLARAEQQFGADRFAAGSLATQVVTAFEAAGLVADLLLVIEDAAADLTDSRLSSALVQTRASFGVVGDRLAQLVQLERIQGGTEA